MMSVEVAIALLIGRVQTVILKNNNNMFPLLFFIFRDLVGVLVRDVKNHLLELFI